MNITQKILLIGLLLFSSVIFAQKTPPKPNRGGTPPGEMPIDGLVLIGGAMALAYGAIKKYKK